MGITYTPIANSTFLDAVGNGLATPGDIAALNATTSVSASETIIGTYLPGGSIRAAAGGDNITLALTLNRANDPSALLGSNWASREAQLAALDTAGSLWTTYGADPAIFNATESAITSLLGTSSVLTPQTAAGVATGYVSSAADRTIWLTLTPDQFTTLFNTTMLASDYWSQIAWSGQLSLPSAIAANVSGIWADAITVAGTPDSFMVDLTPQVLDTTQAPIPQGPQGIGNTSTQMSRQAPSSLLAQHYNYPLYALAGVATPTIGLFETPVGPDYSTLLTDYNAFRTAIGEPTLTSGQFTINSGGSGNNPAKANGEMMLDISVLAGAAPNSPVTIYSTGTLGGGGYTAYQTAYFDGAATPAVFSSSYSIFGNPTSASPFANAFSQLFVDGALANVSTAIAGGDSGAQAAVGTGMPFVRTALAPTLAMIVGGTSLSTYTAAANDPTLAALFTLAVANDPGTLEALAAAGMQMLPANMAANDPNNVQYSLFETVWNTYYVSAFSGKINGSDVPPGTLNEILNENFTGSGGVDTTQAVPSYQMLYGLNPTANGPAGGSGRGVPDVTALSSGNTSYATLGSKYVEGDPSAPMIVGSGGTSAATPQWAALSAQIDAVFADQGLPQLGYYNDMLYNAAAIAPGAFNDLRLGNNIGTYSMASGPAGSGTSYVNTSQDSYITPTGLGYTAGQGYDLTSGLGSPNGTVLARTLSAIAWTQTDMVAAPGALASKGVLDTTGVPANATLTYTAPAAATETLLVETTLTSGSHNVAVTGAGSFTVTGGSDASWSAQLAQQSLQPGFDPGLVTMLDGYGASTVESVTITQGNTLGISLDGTVLPLYQALMTNPFGFVQFALPTGNVGVPTQIVTLARPVAVANLAGDSAAAPPNVILRERQNGGDTTQLQVYRVDDFTGVIGALHPGDAGYAAAAAGRAYLATTVTTANGGVTTVNATSITSPGQGNWQSVALSGINQGDLIAMKLTDLTAGHVYWGFNGGNEKIGGVGYTHIMSQGLNSFSFEDTYGGGDHDYNDLLVQFDFTSASGHGLLV